MECWTREIYGLQEEDVKGQKQWSNRIRKGTKTHSGPQRVYLNKYSCT
jgi:hypothetical protein